MANVKELEEAFLAAHQAGNTADATRLAAALDSAQRRAPKPGVVEDTIKSVASAVPKGIASMISFPADIMSMLAKPAEFAAAKVGGIFGIPEEKFYGLGQPEAPVRALTGLRDEVEKRTYTPQTEPGRRTGAITEFLSGGVAGGGKAAALPSVLAGFGSEGAGMLTNDNPWWKLAGGFFAPGAYGVHQAYRSTPGQMVREATGELTPQQIAEAKARMALAESQGIRLAGPEAMAPSGIQPLMSDVASSQAGGRVINEFMAQRPGQVKAAVDRNLISQTGAAGTPEQNMARAREAATNVIRETENFRSQAVKPYYGAARNDVVPSPEVEAIIQKLEASRQFVGAANQSAIDDIIGQLRGTNPNAAAMDDTLKALRTSADAPPINATPEQKRAMHVYGGAADDLDATLRANSQNIANARQTFSQISEDIVEPLTAGPVGRVAGKHGYDPANPESLSPITAIANKDIARPESIRELYTKLNKQDPQAFPGIARTWLENTFDQAAQKIQAGDNRMVGANFAKAVYGTPQQEKNFLEVMRGVAQAQGRNPDDVAQGAKNLLEVLQMTGKVPGVGSPTGGRIAANEMASSSGAASVAESISAMPLTGVARRLRQWAMQGNYKELAEAMTAPDSIERLAKLARYNPKTTTAQYMAAGILGLTESGRSGEESRRSR